jgi:hypothetical protein
VGQFACSYSFSSSVIQTPCFLRSFEFIASYLIVLVLKAHLWSLELCLMLAQAIKIAIQESSTPIHLEFILISANYHVLWTKLIPEFFVLLGYIRDLFHEFALLLEN